LKLAQGCSFWSQTQDGLAVLGAEEPVSACFCWRSVDELAVATDSFHTKPLRHWLQSVGRFTRCQR
jgi:hypothetical protein